MALINQGWLVNCDQCQENAFDEIGGYSKPEAIRKAEGCMLHVGKHFFCDNSQCFVEWLRFQSKEARRLAIRQHTRLLKKRQKEIG